MHTPYDESSPQFKNSFNAPPIKKSEFLIKPFNLVNDSVDDLFENMFDEGLDVARTFEKIKSQSIICKSSIFIKRSNI